MILAAADGFEIFVNVDEESGRVLLEGEGEVLLDASSASSTLASLAFRVNRNCPTAAGDALSAAITFSPETDDNFNVSADEIYNLESGLSADDLALELAPPSYFVRGNVDGGPVDLHEGRYSVTDSDAEALLVYLMEGDSQPPCLEAADANNDGEIDFSDVSAILAVLYVGEPAIASPFEVPGSYRGIDQEGLSCEALPMVENCE